MLGQLRLSDFSRFCFVLSLVCAWAWAQSSQADDILHKDGRLLSGQFGRLSKTAEEPMANPNPEASQPIFLCDDQLRRTLVPMRLLQENSLQAKADSPIKIAIKQAQANGRERVACSGPVLGVTPFDQFGRRTITIATVKGPMDVIQGITMITPEWTRVEGLAAGNNIAWDMRIATSSIPREQLSAIVLKSLPNAKDIDQRLKIVQLFISADRYRDAEYELTQLAKDFPTDPLPREVLPTIRQRGAKVLLKELELRQLAGQHQLTWALLNQFPEQDIPGTVMQRVRQEITVYDQKRQARAEIVAELEEAYKTLPGDKQSLWRPIIDEIKTDLSWHTFDRMAAYQNLRVDPKVTPEQRLALAGSGWMLTSNKATQNAKVALSLFKTREYVRQYLLSKTSLEREQLYQQISQEEATTPETIAALMANMKPVFPMPERKDDNEVLEVSVPGQANQANYKYSVFLPKEYDPYRPYATIVCLHAQGMTPASELEWWTGANGPKGRLGQAVRHGYIVIAPHYVTAGQSTFKGTPVEHDIVTKCLRDATRRFNVDTDAVFMSGHSMGADAAWEIALSHPDLWAGVIPINGAARKDPVHFYKQNARTVPFYFVGGELDCGVISQNSVNWDHYFSRYYDVTLVEYLGRGHEHFSDEIIRLFDWMNRKNRAQNERVIPKEFAVTTKRTTDNYFWSVEMRSFKVPTLETRGVDIKQEIKQDGKGQSVIISVPQGDYSVYLSPDMIDFNKPVNVLVNGKNLTNNKIVPAQLRTMLEDVRTRGDRRHPFWAVFE